jgi:methionine-rich copper-binding protein CopC
MEHAMRTSLLIAPLFACATIASASAHAVLTSSTPAAGALLRMAPREVVLTFSEKLEPALSQVSVQNEQGARVDRADLRVSGNQVRVSLAPVGSGFYRVTYRVTSVDTHVTRGDFSFRVGE